MATPEAGREGQRRARREQILDAATRLFDAKGFWATTAEEIAGEAGVTKRTLYRYIGSKQRLLFEIHDRFTHRAIIESLAALEGDPVTRMRRLMGANARIVIRYQADIRVFLEEMKHLEPENRAEIDEQRDRYESIWQQEVREGMRSGAFAEGDAFLVTRGILGALTEMYRWYTPTGPLNPDEVAHVMTDLVFRGLRQGCETPLRPATDSARVDVNSSASVGTAWSGEPLKEILAAATKLFSSKGYDGTTTREIARAAGLTKGALYYHIGRKEEMLFRLHDLVTTEGLNSWSNMVDNDRLTGAQTITNMFIEHCEIVAAHRDEVAVMSEEMKFLSKEHRLEITEKRDRYTSFLQAAIERAVARDEFATRHPRLVTVILMGMLNSTYRWYRPEGRLTPTMIGEELASLSLDGLLVPAARDA